MRYVCTKESQEGYFPVGSISTLIKEVREQVYFDNGDLNMITVGSEFFYAHHQPLKEFLIENLKLNKFQVLFLVLENMRVPDLAVIMGNYKAAMQHRNAGGSIESVENQLAKVRVFIQEVINKL